MKSFSPVFHRYHSKRLFDIIRDHATNRIQRDASVEGWHHTGVLDCGKSTLDPNKPVFGVEPKRGLPARFKG
jgi:hypothetical protein